MVATRSGIGITFTKVIAIIVIDIAVVVIVNAVAGDFLGVHPHIGGKVRMIVINATVNDGNNDLLAARGDVPGFCGTDVNARISRVLHTPEEVEHRVIRNCGQLTLVVRLDILNCIHLAEFLNASLQVEGLRNFNQVGTRYRELSDGLRTQDGVRPLNHLLGDRAVELDQ